MKIKSVKRFSYDFSNSGVLSDLAFLLLVFFLAVGTFIPVWGYRMNSAGEQGATIAQSLELELTETGFRMDGKKISTFMAGHRVTEAVAKDADAKITLSVAPEVEYQTVVSAIDILKKAGAKDLSLYVKADRQAP